MFYRKCDCGNVTSYKRINRYNLAEKLQSLCKKCNSKIANNRRLETEMSRKCPLCSKILTYDRLNSYTRADKNNSKCFSCRLKRKRSPYRLPNCKKGHGICGSYKGNHFRSSYELYYMMFMERFSIRWTSAEKLPGIEYLGNEKIRKYKADFLINNKYLVEIKPKKLQTTASNLAKRIAAEKFCKENGMIYKVRDLGCFTLKEMFEMHEKGVIELPDTYVRKHLTSVSS